MRKVLFIQETGAELEKLLDELEAAWAGTDFAESRVYKDLEDKEQRRKAAKAGRAEQRKQKREGWDD